MPRLDIDINYLVYDFAINNSEQAYKQLFKVLYSPLKHFAYSILKSNEQAEEVVDDVMITLWRNRYKLLEVRNIKVYTYVIAKNAALNILKKNAEGKGIIVDLDETNIDINFDYLTPEQILINVELKKSIDQVVQALPPRCKMVFKLVKEDGLSYREVAEILNISVKTVDAQLVTAVKRIAGVIKLEYNLI